MQTKKLMIYSAVFMFVLGLMLTFAPGELVVYAGAVPHPFLALVIQAAGALYLGFAMLNWMAKDNLLGGIYSRPVALGNFLHFVIFGLALVRFCAANPWHTYLLIVTSMYALFALWFAIVTFGSPVERVAR